jgi:hypothetical protein
MKYMPSVRRAPGIERRKDARLAVSRAALDVLEPGVREEMHREFAAFLDAAILGRNRRLADPFLQPRDRFVDLPRDGVVNRRKAGGAGRACGHQPGGARGGACDEIASVESGHGSSEDDEATRTCSVVRFARNV